MRTRRFVIMVAVLITLATALAPLGASAGPVTMKYEGNDAQNVTWGMETRSGYGMYLPVTPYVSDISGVPLISMVFITIHDPNNYGYWARVGFCYANPAYDAANGTKCSYEYNNAGPGQWVPILQICSTDCINGIPDTYTPSTQCATSGNGLVSLYIDYVSGDTNTTFGAGCQGFSEQTGFSRYGFMPVNAGGYSNVENGNPANGAAVWIGGLGQSNAAIFPDLVLCSTPRGQSSQGCVGSYWSSSYPSSTYSANSCSGSCPYGGTLGTDSLNAYDFYFWTKPY